MSTVQRETESAISTSIVGKNSAIKDLYDSMVVSPLMKVSDSFAQLSNIQKVGASAAALLAVSAVGFGAARVINSNPNPKGGPGLSRVLGAGGAWEVKPVEAFRGLANYLDNPQQIFQEAGYKQTFSVTKDKAFQTLDGRLVSIPKESRTWEPWFRNTLKNGNQVLSTAELLRVRTAVADAVISDPRTEWNGGAPGLAKADYTSYVAKKIEEVRKDAVSAAGFDSPSSELVQLTTGDAVAAWVTTTTRYGDKNKDFDIKTGVWPTSNELLSKSWYQDLICANSSDLFKALIRAIEANKVSNGDKNTGMNSYPVTLSLFTPNSGGVQGHGVGLLQIKLADSAQTANVYFDCVPYMNGPRRNMPIENATKRLSMGPIDQASVEVFAACYKIYKEHTDPESLGQHPKFFNGKFTGGERQDIGDLGAAKQKEKPYFPGQPRPKSEWTLWHEANQESINRLYNLVNTWSR